MMKNTKKLIAVLLVLMLSVSILASCGGGLSGTYVISEVLGEDGKMVKYDDQMKEMKAMYEEYDMPFDESEFQMSIEFLKDGKCKMTIGSESMDLTFKVDGKNIEVDDGTDIMKGTIDGNKISFGSEADGDRQIYVKK